MTVTAFIGAGNIAKALMGGLISSNPDVSIRASDPYPAQLDTLPPGVFSTSDNHEAIEPATAVVLCVKPDVMAEICQQLKPVAGGKLFISVAAGITTSSLGSWLGPDAAVIRCMPNTPALIGEGMTGLFASNNVSAAQRLEAAAILGSVGKIAWFEDEAQLDLVTAVSGSGPAYFFLMLEAMQAAAVNLGLSPEIARMLTQQTGLGAIKMAISSELDVGQLRKNVTSPGGTTAAAIDVMQSEGLEQTILNAISAAAKRSRALSAD